MLLPYLENNIVTCAKEIKHNYCNTNFYLILENMFQKLLNFERFIICEILFNTHKICTQTQ